MAFLTRIGRFILDVLRPDPILSPELQAYCRSEGVDPLSLQAKASEPVVAPARPDAKTIAWTPCQEDGTCVDSA